MTEGGEKRGQQTDKGQTEKVALLQDTRWDDLHHSDDLAGENHIYGTGFGPLRSRRLPGTSTSTTSSDENEPVYENIIQGDAYGEGVAHTGLVTSLDPGSAWESMVNSSVHDVFPSESEDSPRPALLSENVDVTNSIYDEVTDTVLDPSVPLRQKLPAEGKEQRNPPRQQTKSSADMSQHNAALCDRRRSSRGFDSLGIVSSTSESSQRLHARGPPSASGYQQRPQTVYTE